MTKRLGIGLLFSGVLMFQYAGAQAEPVQTFPVAKGCEEIAKSNEQLLCTQAFIRDFVLERISAPKELKEGGGKVRVSFFINEVGRTEDLEVTDSLHPEIDKQVCQAILDLPAFTPATLMGKPVRMSYAVPIYLSFK